MSKILKLARFWPEIFLLFSVLFFLREYLFLGKIMLTPDWGLGDFALGFFPYGQYLSEALKAGRLPLWMPELNGGFPIIASGEAVILYPINLILFYLFPPERAFSFYTLFSYLLLGFSLFYLLRSFNLSKEASLVGTLSLIFSAGLSVRMVHLTTLGTLAYLPLSLLLVQKFFIKRNPLILILTAVILALMILNYHPPTTFLTYLTFLFFFLFKSVSTAKKLKTNLLSLFLIFVLAFSLSAVQILPIMNVFSESTRKGGVSEVERKEFAFHPQELGYFIKADPLGDFSQGTYQAPSALSFVWENNAYIGILGLLFGLLAIVLLWRTKNVFFFTLLFLFSLLLALGKFTPFSFIHEIPPFSLLRVPGRYLLLSMFSLSILSAFGFEKILSYLRNLSHLQRAFLSLLTALIILIDLLPFSSSYNVQYDAKKWLSVPETAKILKKDDSFFRIYAIDPLGSFFAAYNQSEGWQKSFEPFYNLREGIPPNLNLVYSINSANGLLALPSSRSENWEQTLKNNILVNPEKLTLKVNNLGIRLLRLKNVKYLTTPYKIENDNFSLISEAKFESNPTIYLYELANPFPHAFIVYQAKTFPSLDELTKEFAKEDFDPLKTVLLEDQFDQLDKLVQLDKSSSEKAEIISYEPEKVVIKAKTDKPGFLVLTDTYYPGWKAYMRSTENRRQMTDGRLQKTEDRSNRSSVFSLLNLSSVFGPQSSREYSQELKIYQANYLFRAVQLAPGEHEVVFEYKPKELYLGAIISITTASLIILFSLGWIIFTRRSGILDVRGWIKK